jgi:chromosome partitioning protein
MYTNDRISVKLWAEEPRVGRIIAIANQKGGVGKTTTAINLGASLGSLGKRCLLIDSDSQANATSALGFPREPARRTLYHSLILGEAVTSLILRTTTEGLDLLPSDKNLVGAAVEMVQMENREYRLRGALAIAIEPYDYTLIDCPPALDLLTVNALAASESVLVPIQCEYLALEGVSELLDTLMRLRRAVNPSLRIEGIVLTMYDDRTMLSRQVASDLRSFFGTQVFESVIPRNVRLAEAPSHGKPVLTYDPRSRGAESYIALAKEIIANDKKRAGKGLERFDSGARDRPASEDTAAS